MNAYFVETVDQSVVEPGNWWTDAGATTPLGGLPAGGDDVFIQSGTCDTTDGLAFSTLRVDSGAILTVNYYGVVLGVNAGTVVTNQGTIESNSGSITTNANGGMIDTNASGATVVTNASGGTVSVNYGTVTTNNGAVSNNNGTVTTNGATGAVGQNNSDGVVTTNNGNVNIGSITGGTGTISASTTTDLSNHTAGSNVTLPSGGGSDILGAGLL